MLTWPERIRTRRGSTDSGGKTIESKSSAAVETTTAEVDLETTTALVVTALLVTMVEMVDIKSHLTQPAAIQIAITLAQVTINRAAPALTTLMLAQ
jgi:hypothetical protein